MSEIKTTKQGFRLSTVSWERVCVRSIVGATEHTPRTRILGDWLVKMYRFALEGRISSRATHANPTPDYRGPRPDHRLTYPTRGNLVNSAEMS